MFLHHAPSFKAQGDSTSPWLIAEVSMGIKAGPVRWCPHPEPHELAWAAVPPQHGPVCWLAEHYGDETNGIIAPQTRNISFNLGCVL